MKKLISIPAFLIVTIIFISCDRVKNPFVKKNTIVGKNFVTKTNTAYSNSKKTLIEDYTGAQCKNCPPAAITAASLAVTYTPNVVIVAVHAGFFATPYGAYTDDYRTNTGEIWKSSSGFNIQSNPNGMVNRTNYSGNGLITTETKWPTTTFLAQNDPFVLKLNVTTNYDTIVGALNTDVAAVFKTAYADPIKICIVVTEDEIVGKQLDDATVVEDYEFEHMLRGDINGTWGADLTTGAKAAGDTVKYSYPNFNLKGMSFVIDKPDPTPDVVKPIIVNDKHVTVVVIAYKASTKEVIQVEQVKIR